jgi:nitrogen regulatory protein PII
MRNPEMKLIRCKIDTEYLDWAIRSLVNVVTGLTVRPAHEDSPETNLEVVYRAQRYVISPPRFVLEIVSDDTWVDDILLRLAHMQKTEPFADRDVEVVPVDASYRVRTGFMEV